MRIAAQVGTPLALAGLVCALFFYLLSKIITPDFLPKLTQTQGARVLQLTIRSFFILSIVATCLGFLGWLIGKVMPARSETGKAHVRQTAIVAPQSTNYGIVVGNISTEQPTQPVVQVVQNYGIPTEKYEALIRTGAVTQAALDRFFKQINDTNDFDGDLAARLQNAVHRYEQQAEDMKHRYELQAAQMRELRAMQESNAATIASMQEGIAALRRGDLATASKLIKIAPPPPTGLRIVAQ